MRIDEDYIFRLYDRVSGMAIGQVMLFKSNPPAIRTFHDVLRQPDSQLAAHAADYDLVCVGRCGSDGKIVSDEFSTVSTGEAYVAMMMSSGGSDA